MATRFEPTKSGEYLVEYRVGGYHYYKEKVHYDRKTEQWIGSKPPAFYKKYITSWYYYPSKGFGYSEVLFFLHF